MTIIQIIKKVKMEFKLFIRNIPYNIDEKEFKMEIQKIDGVIDCNLIMKFGQPINKGYGFVSVNSEDIQNELLTTNSVTIGGRIIRFTKYSNQQKYYKLHVMNIPIDISESELLNFFSRFGQVDSVKRDYDVMNKQYKNTAVVVYDNYEDFKSVLELKTIKYDGQVTFDIVKRRTFNKNPYNNGFVQRPKFYQFPRNNYQKRTYGNVEKKKLNIIRPNMTQ
jgi:RNA recognition motif-containing protein